MEQGGRGLVARKQDLHGFHQSFAAIENISIPPSQFQLPANPLLPEKRHPLGIHIIDLQGEANRIVPMPTKMRPRPIMKHRQLPAQGLMSQDACRNKIQKLGDQPCKSIVDPMSNRLRHLECLSFLKLLQGIKFCSKHRSFIMGIQLEEKFVSLVFNAEGLMNATTPHRGCFCC